MPMQISEPAEYTLLGLFQTQPMHGYEVFQYFEHGALGQIIHLEMSQMYAFLKKLEHLQYIEATIETQGSRPPRKIFHLTSTGHSIFMEWLFQPVQKTRDAHILFLIKLYFVQRFAPEATISLVERQIQSSQHFLDHLREKQQEPPLSRLEIKDTSFFEDVVLSSRIHQTQALIDWLREFQASMV
jgi:DNA-binding PadR family transcriptional regulator